MGEVLLARSIAEKSSFLTSKSNAEINIPEEAKELITTPTIVLRADKVGDFAEDLSRRLFYASIVHLATIYEVFLTELIKEILFRNDSLLMNQEKKFTAKEIFEHENIASIKRTLIEQTVVDFSMLSYPRKVEKLQHRFHVGIHDKRSPLTQFQVHDFLEVRNVIVHNDGHATPTYVERMRSYDEVPLLKLHHRLTPEFSWLLAIGRLLIELCIKVDREIAAKWETTYQENAERLNQKTAPSK